MIVSLGEISETAKKAVSGKGHCFGIAEDMGYATRWLCERGFPGADSLIDALERFADVTPDIEQTTAELTIAGANDMPIPALSVAPSIGEFLVALRKPLRVPALANPLLLIPFLARSANDVESVSAQWTTAKDSSAFIIANVNGVRVLAPSAAVLMEARADNVECRLGETTPNGAPLYSPAELEHQRKANIAHGCKLDDAVWEKMLKFAHNTYVPISDQSRLRGAGAGLTDND